MTAPHLARGRRLEVPPLEWRPPECPLCGAETDPDGDAFVCHSCSMVWPLTAGEPGDPIEDDVPQCRVMVAPFTMASIADQWFRCVLDVDHREDGNEEHIGVRSDRNPWAPGDEVFRWADRDIERGRYRVARPVQGPTPRDYRPWAAGPASPAQPPETAATVSPVYL